MAISFNIGFIINAPQPIDSRFTVADLAARNAMAMPYDGLITYVVDQNLEYRYVGGSWILYQPGGGGGGAAVWGSIGGTLSAQTDLNSALNAKLNLSGGNMTGALTNTNDITANNFITTG